jgi:hypothetical protein
MAEELQVVHIFDQGPELTSATLKAAALTTFGIILLEAVEPHGNRT